MYFNKILKLNLQYTFLQGTQSILEGTGNNCYHEKIILIDD